MSNMSVDAAESAESQSSGSSRWLGMAARVLALVGAAMVAVAIWLPWATGIQTVSEAGQQRLLVLQISAGDVDSLLSLFAWSLVTALGVPLSCLLWIHGPRILRMLALGCFLLWTFASLGIITPVLNILLTANPVQLRPELDALQLAVTHRIRPAMILTYLGILIALLAAVLGFMELRRSSAAEPAPVRILARPKVPAAGILTLSTILFLVGVFVMPWATVNCTQTPLFIGQCTGVSFAGAASQGIRAHVGVFDPLAAKYAIPILLAGGALLTLIGVWRRGIFRAGGLWLVFWLLVATCFAVLGDLGVGAVVANAPALGLSAGKWSGDTGIVVAFLGLLLGWGSALFLGIVTLRARNTVEARGA